MGLNQGPIGCVVIEIFELKEYIERVYPLVVTDFFEYTHEMNTLMAHRQH